MAVLNTLTIFGNDYFVSPEDYQFYYEGETSKLVSSSNGHIMDISYARPCFNAKLIINDANDALSFQANAQTAINTLSPITITDTVYPNGRTWIGFFKMPILVAGTMPDFNGQNIVTTALSVTFCNIELELA